MHKLPVSRKSGGSRHRRTTLAVIASLAAFIVMPSLPALAASSLTSDSATAATGDIECRTGFPAPQCWAQPYDTSANLGYQGNGDAAAAVAKDTIPGHPTIHGPQFANDGYYGNGSSWIGTSPNSWVKIDLGCQASVDSIRFGRDRLEGFNDRGPGQVSVLGAISDDVYANGNELNDGLEYTKIAGFTGVEISKGETLKASFDPVRIRYIKLQVATAGTAIDEIEVHGDGCAPPTPTSKDDCKNGGWEALADDEGTQFTNQGDCVSYVATGGENKARDNASTDQELLESGAFG